MPDPSVERVGFLIRSGTNKFAGKVPSMTGPEKCLQLFPFHVWCGGFAGKWADMFAPRKIFGRRSFCIAGILHGVLPVRFINSGYRQVLA